MKYGDTQADGDMQAYIGCFRDWLDGDMQAAEICKQKNEFELRHRVCKQQSILKCATYPRSQYMFTYPRSQYPTRDLNIYP